jgi:hypothetical protein
MTFGQILDCIYRLMRSNLKLFIGIAAVPAVAFLLILAIVFAVALVPIIGQLPKQPDPRAVLGLMAPAIFVVMLLNMVVFALYLAASIHAASQAHLGLKITFREAYAVAWNRGWRYLWLMFLAYLVAFLPALLIELAMIVPMGLFAVGKTSPVTAFVYMIPMEMLLFLGASVYGVIMAMRFSLAFPASLAEDLTAWAAIRRSGQLTQGAKGRIFLVLLVIYALAYAAEMVGLVVLMVIFGVGALAVAALHITLASVAGVIGVGLGAVCFLGFIFLFMALIWSAFSTSLAVLYHDHRLRKGGLLTAPTPAGEPA